MKNLLKFWLFSFIFSLPFFAFADFGGWFDYQDTNDPNAGDGVLTSKIETGRENFLPLYKKIDFGDLLIDFIDKGVTKACQRELDTCFFFSVDSGEVSYEGGKIKFNGSFYDKLYFRSDSEISFSGNNSGEEIFISKSSGYFELNGGTVSLFDESGSPLITEDSTPFSAGSISFDSSSKVYLTPYSDFSLFRDDFNVISVRTDSYFEWTYSLTEEDFFSKVKTDGILVSLKNGENYFPSLVLFFEGLDALRKDSNNSDFKNNLESIEVLDTRDSPYEFITVITKNNGHLEFSNTGAISPALNGINTINEDGDYIFRIKTNGTTTFHYNPYGDFCDLDSDGDLVGDTYGFHWDDTEATTYSGCLITEEVHYRKDVAYCQIHDCTEEEKLEKQKEFLKCVDSDGNEQDFSKCPCTLPPEKIDCDFDCSNYQIDSSQITEKDGDKTKFFFVSSRAEEDEETSEEILKTDFLSVDPSDKPITQRDQLHTYQSGSVVYVKSLLEDNEFFLRSYTDKAGQGGAPVTYEGKAVSTDGPLAFKSGKKDFFGTVWTEVYSGARLLAEAPMFLINSRSGDLRKIQFEGGIGEAPASCLDTDKSKLVCEYLCQTYKSNVDGEYFSYKRSSDYCQCYSRQRDRGGDLGLATHIFRKWVSEKEMRTGSGTDPFYDFEPLTGFTEDDSNDDFYTAYQKLKCSQKLGAYQALCSRSQSHGKGYSTSGYRNFTLGHFRTGHYSHSRVVQNCKPVIYLYPEEESDVYVNLDYQGTLDVTYPKIDEKISGWLVKAQPNGDLFNYGDGKDYSYLFWEGHPTEKVDYQTDKGFVVKGEDTDFFLQKTLSYLGMTPKEYNEFIVYWYPIMKQNKYNFISFAGKEYEKLAPLNIYPRPDSMLRVFMLFKALDEPVEVEPQLLFPFKRKGFSVVEWGGGELE